MPLLPAVPELPPAARGGGLRRLIGWAWTRLRFFAGHVQPPPPRTEQLERALYGAAQPALGLRVILANPDLLVEALVPVAWMGAACAVYAGTKAGFHFSGPWFKQFYTAFAVLAPLPSVVFANHYARFAALVRYRLGFGTFGPRELPLTNNLRRLLMQTALQAIGLAPILLVTQLLPGGESLRDALLVLWGIHWVVVESFDDATVLQPGQTVAQAEREAEKMPRPWFVRMFRWLEKRLPGPDLLRRVAGTFASLVDRLSKPWREEIALLESSPRMGVGFAASTAALLAIPVLNLLFRPVIIAAASHMLAHAEKAEHAEAPEALEHQPEQEHAGLLHEAPPPQKQPIAPLTEEQLALLAERLRGR